MRRKDREITDINEILKIIGGCKVCRLGLSDNDRPYVVPLNYGWSFDNNALTFYFHSAVEGKKLDIIKNNSRACFEIDTDHKLVEAAEPCKHGFAYSSVIAFGSIEFISEPKEKIYALNMMMKHQSGKDAEHNYSEEALSRVCVYKMIADEFSGKARH